MVELTPILADEAAALIEAETGPQQSWAIHHDNLVVGVICGIGAVDPAVLSNLLRALQLWERAQRALRVVFQMLGRPRAHFGKVAITYSEWLVLSRSVESTGLALAFQNPDDVARRVTDTRLNRETLTGKELLQQAQRVVDSNGTIADLAVLSNRLPDSAGIAATRTSLRRACTAAGIPYPTFRRR